jgi:hypothetical protein
MPDFGIFRGFNDKLFGNKLYAGQLPTQLGTIGSVIIPIALLDLYPNAAAAYSLRKLRSAYTGSAIRVRNASNAEQDIGFDAFGNLDTSALTSFCGSGNGFVTTWFDQSGNNLNVTQTTAANQPQIVSSGSVININSKPSLKFDGSNDFLNGGDILDIGSNSFMGIGFATINTASTGSLYAKSIAAAGSDRYAFIRESTQYTALFNPNTGVNIIQFNASLGNQLYCQQIIRGVSHTAFINNVQQAIDATVGNYNINSTYRFLLGAYNNSTDTGQQLFLNGNLSEFVFYLNDQSSNRTGISTNINSYYGIY